MGRRTIHVCDGCGAERAEEELATGGVMYSGPSTIKWGHLHVGGPLGPLPIAFDLCDSCIAKIVKLLGLHVPDEQEMSQMMGEYMGVPGVPHIRRGGVARRRPGMRVVSGGLTKEDLEQLGIRTDGGLSEEIDDIVGQAMPPRPRGVSCACHDGYKCIPEACTGHCDKCLGRDGA